MGAFNTVTINIECEKCGYEIPINIQFKYGDVWQHHYQIGDGIKWNKNNVGTPGHKRVVVEAYSEDCPICKQPGKEYEVYLENDIIVDAMPAEGNYDFIHRDQPHIVLED